MRRLSSEDVAPDASSRQTPPEPQHNPNGTFESTVRLALIKEHAAPRGDEPSLARPPAREHGAAVVRDGELISELHFQLKNKADILDWIIRSRTWRYTAWLRRLNFLRIKMLPGLRHLQRGSFRGELEEPGEGARVSCRLDVRGWAYSSAADVSHVEAFLDTVSLGTLRYGHTRLDAAAYPSEAPVNCGFEGVLPIDESFVGQRRLTVRVTDQSGCVVDYERTIQVVEPEERDADEGAGAFSRNGLRASPGFDPEDELAVSKKILDSLGRLKLETLLSRNALIEFPQQENPATSIILVLYNRAELTLQCFDSILRNGGDSYEVVIVNNASTDETSALLSRVRGARVIENKTNVHYLRACNQAARLARGRYVLLLNNDAQLLSGAVSTAIETLDSADDIGAVGGKLILPDGTLQEAGSIVWRDGSCLGYGRGDSPAAPAYMFRRDVDYCSAAFLLTRRDLFLEGGGFDEAFAPAYYEETDYCARLWERGLRVVYEPNAVAVHYEFASSGSAHGAVALQVKNRKGFVEKHGDWLSAKHPPTPDKPLAARSPQPRAARRVLYIDDRVPHVNLGSGFPRSNRILSELVRMRHQVTLYPLTSPKEDWASAYRDIPREVEVMLDHGAARLEAFLNERANFYDYVFVSRPHNMLTLQAVLAHNPGLLARAKIIYDAEAIFSLREIERARLKKQRLSPDECRRLIDEELRLAEGCHSVIAVSESEGREFSRLGFERVHTLGHAIAPAPTPRPFDERAGLLFVGSLYSPSTPNADSIIWFVERVLPLIRSRLGKGLQLDIAGPITHRLRERLAGESVNVLGKVDDLTELYDRARVFIAPTRFSAGIPHKVHEAAAHGLPVVATMLIGRQLDWTHGEELLLADRAAGFAEACVTLYRDRDLWHRVRDNALKRIETDCSPDQFSDRLKAIVE